MANLNELEVDSIIEQLNSGQLSYEQFYNLDLEITQHLAIQHYAQYQHDSISKEQKLNTLFFDIEVYSYNSGEFRPDKAMHPVSAITIYSTFDKTYHCFFLILPIIGHIVSNAVVPQLEIDFKKELIEAGYIPEDENVKIHLYTNETILLQECWNKIHDIDPAVLSGFYSDKFDIPYIYNRLKNLFGGDVNKVNQTLSKVGCVKIRKMGAKGIVFQIADYPLLDLQYLYKPRGEGGLNYGKTQANYTLDWISQQVLGLKKLEYNKEGHSLDKFYEVDPLGYLKYNIIDVVLCARLNDKLQHIELHNLLRRDMKTPLNISLRGSSALFDTYFSYDLETHGKKMRYGVTQEMAHSLSDHEVKSCAKPKEKKVKWTIKKVGEQEYRKILSRFEGAYVKEGLGAVVDSRQGLVIDMDASLPPWEKIIIKRNNKIYWNKIGSYNYMEGDETLTWDNDHNSCWRKVLGKTEHNWDGQLVKITTETGKVTTVTTNHSIFGIKKGTKTTNVETIDANQLQKGDYVVGLKQFNPETNQTLNHPNLAGFWLSDGWKNGNNFYVGQCNESLLIDYGESLRNLKLARKAGGSMNYDEYRAIIVDGFEIDPFYESQKKKNFLEILNYAYEDRLKIWDGMMIGDGTLKGQNQADTTNCTERLCKYREPEIDECFLVAHTIGWRPRRESNGIANVPDKVDMSNRYGPDLVCSEVFKGIKGASYKLQQNNMHPNFRHPLDKVKTIVPEVNKIYTDSVGLERIKSVEFIDYSGKVYDISVEETERFFAGTGIGAHNTALYPSMMMQHNISFDSYYGRVIDPVSYKMLNVIQGVLGTTKELPKIHNDIFGMVTKYVDKLGPQNKNDYKQLMYFIIIDLLTKLKQANRSVAFIMNPTTQDDYVLLKMYLIPLLDLISEIHPKGEEYNTFAHDYLLNQDINHIPSIFVIEDANNPTIRISKINTQDTGSFLKDNNINLNLSGALFYTHEHKLGTVNQFLIDRLAMRKEYKDTRNTFGEGSEEYVFNDHRQLACKVNANSSYGLTGMSGFRFSNKWLAKSTTISGRLALKVSQICGETYLNSLGG